MIVPNLKEEKSLISQGYKYVIGIDEVGRGAWAGPLVVGAVILPRNKRLYKIRDSKLLTREKREQLFPKITNWVSGWAVGEVSSFEIDKLGLSKSIQLAAQRAIFNLRINIDFVLIDGNWNYLKDIYPKNFRTIKSGDSLCLSIATASILAKFIRDRKLTELHSLYPNYNFKNNKGYPTKEHINNLSQFGPCEIHRQSYAPIKSYSKNIKEIKIKR